MTNMATYRHALKKYFGLDSFWPAQLEALENIVMSKDVFCVSPTGSGKSMLYQIPAFVDESGITILVSPLLATIQDQLSEINQILPNSAKSWCGSTSSTDKDSIKQDILCGAPPFKILICTPESFVKALRPILAASNVKINRIAIDEVHLIRQWGLSFRNAFIDIAKCIKWLEQDRKISIPLIMLTATADPEFLIFIRNLFSRSFTMTKESPIRNNIEYEVIDAQHHKITHDKKRPLDLFLTLKNSGNDYNSVHLIRIVSIINQAIKKESKSIVFCATRSNVDKISCLLNEVSSLVVYRYHGNLSASEREAIAYQYKMEKRACVMVTTNSFGVGVNIPDIRLCIHADLPANIDAFLQESGRIGRDGRPSKSIVLINNKNEISSSHYLLHFSYPPTCSVRELFSELYELFDRSQYNGFSIQINKQQESAFRLLVRRGVVSADDTGNRPFNNYFVTSVLNCFDFETYSEARQRALEQYKKMVEYSELDNSELINFLLTNYNHTEINQSVMDESIRVNDDFILDQLTKINTKYSYDVIKCNPSTLISNKNMKKLVAKIKENKVLLVDDVTLNINVDIEIKRKIVHAINAAMRSLL